MDYCPPSWSKSLRKSFPPFSPHQELQHHLHQPQRQWLHTKAHAATSGVGQYHQHQQGEVQVQQYPQQCSAAVSSRRALRVTDITIAFIVFGRPQKEEMPAPNENRHMSLWCLTSLRCLTRRSSPIELDNKNAIFELVREKATHWPWLFC